MKVLLGEFGLERLGVPLSRNCNRAMLRQDPTTYQKNCFSIRKNFDEVQKKLTRGIGINSDKMLMFQLRMEAE